MVGQGVVSNERVDERCRGRRLLRHRDRARGRLSGRHRGGPHAPPRSLSGQARAKSAARTSQASPRSSRLSTPDSSVRVGGLRGWPHSRADLRIRNDRGVGYWRPFSCARVVSSTRLADTSHLLLLPPARGGVFRSPFLWGAWCREGGGSCRGIWSGNFLSFAAASPRNCSMSCVALHDLHGGQRAGVRC